MEVSEEIKLKDNISKRGPDEADRSPNAKPSVIECLGYKVMICGWVRVLVCPGLVVVMVPDGSKVVRVYYGG